MRKFFFFLLTALLLLTATSACAETLTFDAIHAACDIPDSYILLTPGNLDRHEEWIANRGTTKDALLNEWEERGVLAQAWSTEGDVCLEISAAQDDLAQQYYDIDQQTKQIRSSYRSLHLKGEEFKAQGYTYQSAEWKKNSDYGRFLILKYKREIGGETMRGYARRTIRNGYTITLDYQVYGRGLKNADNSALNNIMKTWRFTQVLSKPAEVASKVVFTSTPPTETNTGEFTVAGTCDPGMHLVGVIMRMSSPDPILLEATAGKTGKFSMDVQLPEEGVWLMTMTVENGDVVTEDVVFDTTTYQKTLLPVNFDEDVPLRFDVNEASALPGDELVISGKTIRNVKIQCIVEGAATYNKQVTTNNSGKFSFKINTKAEGTYNVTVVFQKKNYDTRRFTTAAIRTLTEADVRAQIKEEAVKPAYSTLKSKLKGYTGRIMRYDLYVMSVEQSGDQWIIQMAMNRSKSGKYSNIVYVMTKEEPNFSVDSQHRMYGTCTGAYQVENKTYPCFDLLFWE